MEVSGQLPALTALSPVPNIQHLKSIGGCVGSRASLDMVVKKNILALVRNQTQVVYCVASHFTELPQLTLMIHITLLCSLERKFLHPILTQLVN
jgi:hypothetical protein